MIDQPPGDSAAVHPHIRWEREDISERNVWIFGLFLAAGIALCIFAMIGLYLWLESAMNPTKKSDLPPAYVEENVKPVGPTLEGFDDVRDGHVELFPPRAARLLLPEEKKLAEGDAADGKLPIAQGMEAIASRFGKKKDGAGPGGTNRKLPSKASAGRTSTGGNE
jgi:hypothetical protein